VSMRHRQGNKESKEADSHYDDDDDDCSLLPTSRKVPSHSQYSHLRSILVITVEHNDGVDCL